MNWHNRMAQKRRNEDQANAQGIIADSMDVRRALMQKFRSGECTLDEVQAELSAIQRNAKKSGKITREQARNGRNR